MPSRPLLSLLFALALLPPFVAQASGSVVGSFTMFNRVGRYHLELDLVGNGGARKVPVRSLAPHLSHEARPIVLPAAGDAVGADQIDVVAASLPAMARLLCDLHPDAERTRARLFDDPFDRTRTVERSAERACHERR